MDSSITLKNINDLVVEKINIPIETRPVRGAEIVSDAYTNIFIIGSTNAGKTSLIFKLLKEFCGKSTKIIAFVSTLLNDTSWISIRKYFDKKGIEFEGYTSITEDGRNHLNELVEDLTLEAKDREEKEDAKEEDKEEVQQVDIFELMRKRINFVKVDEENSVPQEKKEKKSKYLDPEYVIVCDDLASEIKTPQFANLLKSARHFHLKTITSTQYLKDLLPSARAQVRVVCAFGGLSKDKLEELHKFLNIRLPISLFMILYKYATTPSKQNPKPFMFINPQKEDYRVSLNKRFIIPEHMILNT